MRIDPVVHRVAGDHRNLGQVRADSRLQYGIDVREEEKLGVLILGGNLRLEFCEHVQIGRQCVRLVQIAQVLTLPVEAFTGRAFDAPGVHASLRQHALMLRQKVLAHHADDTHLGEVACRQGEVSRRSTQHAFTLATRRLQ